jgi:predicted transposase/invertase (TIGR01784 family)
MIIEIDPRVDIVFHNLFGSLEHPRLTMSLLNSLLDRVNLPKAIELRVENPFQFALYLEQKESELDILYRDENDRQVQLEMQIRWHEGLPQRMLHNWTQLYQRQLMEGQEYHEHVPAISVWILDKPLFHDKCWLHIFRCRDEDNGLVLHDDQCIITIELRTWQSWLAAGKESILDPLNRWLYFLTKAKGADDEALLNQLQESEFKEAINVIEGYTNDQKLRHAYDMRQNYKRLVNSYIYTGYKKGKEEGIELGVERAERSVKLDLARKLRDKGMSAEEIIELTGLTTEDLQELH